jgi:hypothetical protein
MNLTNQATVTERPPTADPASPGGIDRTRRLAWPLGAITAGWLVSGVATVAGVDWILLPLLVVTVASVLRTGRNVVDRLMLGTILVSGALVAGGLLFSIWPWGLAPFPVAGSVFTAVALFAWAGKRRPRLPRGFSFSDLIILGTGAFVLFAGLRPILRLGYLERFPFAYAAEDRAAHFAIFDTIHRLGSFPFLDQVAARIPLRTPTEADYPVGSHFLYVIVDIFVRSTTDPGPAIAEFQRYFMLVLAGFAFLVMSAVWASRWIISPLVRGWQVTAATATVSAVLISGPFMLLPWSGFDSQILGIAFVGMTVALAVRPPKPIGERVMLLGACVILVTYTYYLYLPLAAIAVLASFVVDRRLLLPAWRPIAVGTAVVGGISVLPLYFAVTSTMGVKAQSLAAGGVIQYSHAALAAASLGSLLFVLTPNALRYRRVRIIGLLVPGWAGVIGLFGIYQKLSIGKTSYYFDKLLACYLVVGIICSATLVMFLSPIARANHNSRAPLREFCAGVVATVLAFTAIAGFEVDPNVRAPFGGKWKESPLGAWYWNKVDPADKQELKDLAQRGILADSVPTLFITTDTPYTNWRITFLNGAMNRINGTIKGSVDIVSGIPPASVNHVTGERFDVEAARGHSDARARQEAIQAEVDLVERSVSLSHVPLRVVVRDSDVANALNRLFAAKPELHATVLLIPPH